VNAGEIVIQGWSPQITTREEQALIWKRERVISRAERCNQLVDRERTGGKVTVDGDRTVAGDEGQLTMYTVAVSSQFVNGPTSNLRG
jgi:hypothetical protein